MPKSSRLLVQALIAAALPLALTACTSGQPVALAVAKQPTALQTTTADPDAGLPTGTQLKAALAPASYFGQGYVTQPENTVDTGDPYQRQRLTDVPKPNCTLLDDTGWVTITGAQGVSFAQGSYLDKPDDSQLAQEIDAYQGTTAGSVEKVLGKVAEACPSFTDPQTKSKVTVTEKPVSGLGDEAFAITLSDSTWASGATLFAVRVGYLIVTVLATGNDDNGAAEGGKLAAYIVGQAKHLA